jgi:hypothetical protein
MMGYNIPAARCGKSNLDQSFREECLGVQTVLADVPEPLDFLFNGVERQFF